MKLGSVFFVKSGPFPHKMKLMLDLHFTYFFWGGVRTHPTHPLPTGLEVKVHSFSSLHWLENESGVEKNQVHSQQVA